MEGGVVLVFNMCIVIYSRRGLLTFGDSKPFSDFLPRQIFFKFCYQDVSSMT